MGMGAERGMRRGGRPERFSFGKKRCRLCKENIETIDYKDYKRLERCQTDRGKIVSSRTSGTCARHQRRLAVAIRRARFLALLPYVNG
jgi:small subunit ribosomal protein S18